MYDLPYLFLSRPQAQISPRTKRILHGSDIHSLTVMHGIPQELVNHISPFLDFNDIKKTLLVSRKFQLAAERSSHAFSMFKFEAVTDEEAETFVEIFGGSRLRYLENIDVQTILPSLIYPKKRRKRDPDPELPRCYETQSELDLKNEIFTQQIQCVFNANQRAETLAGGHDTRKTKLTIRTPIRHVDSQFCPDRQHACWRIHLLTPENLPHLSIIQSLEVCKPNSITYEDYSFKKIDLRILLDLSSKSINLEYLRCKLEHLEWCASSLLSFCRNRNQRCNKILKSTYSMMLNHFATTTKPRDGTERTRPRRNHSPL